MRTSARSSAAGCAIACAACEPPTDLPIQPWAAPVLGEACRAPEVVLVVAAVDGDTLDVRGADGVERVRLLGVDAPELARADLPAACGAEEARQAVEALVDRSVTLGFDRVCADAFGRTLAYAAIPREELAWAWPEAERLLALVDRATNAEESEPDLSVALLAAGRVRRFDEAWVQPLRIERALLAAERLARARGLGLWGSCP